MRHSTRLYLDPTNHTSPRLRKYSIFLCLLIIVAFGWRSAEATESHYYVDAVNGSDTTGDGSSGNAWKTIQHGLNHIWVEDAFLHVAPGTYNEAIAVQEICEGIDILGAGPDVTTIDGSDVSKNGGAIRLPPGTGYTVSGFTIMGGTYEGTGSPGGAIRGGRANGWSQSTTSAVVENNVIKDNFSWGYDFCGGAISLGSDCIIRNNRFENNSANYGSGAVYVGADSVIEDNVFINNRRILGYEGGGAIESRHVSVIIRRNLFLENRSAYLGGAIAGKAMVYNNIFISNACIGHYSYNESGGGAACIIEGEFINNTLVNNSTHVNSPGSGVSCYGSVLVRNNIIVGGDGGTGIYIDTGSAATADFNAFWDNELGPYGGVAVPGDNDIHVDPELTSDHHLLESSPLIDAGTNTDAPEDDIDGDPRPIDGDATPGAVVDIGADEHVPSKIIRFGGYEWQVKTGDWGPGRNHWSDDDSSVWVADDKLHIKIRKVGSTWYCAEISTLDYTQFGIHRIYVDHRLDQLDRNAVFAFFIYKDDNHEVDLEFSQFGLSNPGFNAQYVIQPAPYDSTNLYRFDMSLNGTYSTHYFDWQSNGVQFRSFHGHYEEPPSPPYLIAEKYLQGGNIPQSTDNSRAHINLWLVDVDGNGWGDAPYAGQEIEVIINDVDLPMPPAPPINVSASDGTYTDRIHITWTPNPKADTYEIWRHTSDDSRSATMVGSSSTASYDDTAATSERTYYYWIKAQNSYGASRFSSPDTGYEELAAPAGVTASDGTYADKVRVTWDSVSDATEYRVYRATSSTGTKTALDDWQSGTTYDDTSGAVGTTYYYWVKARNAYGESNYSSYDTGWRSALQLNVESTPITGISITGTPSGTTNYSSQLDENPEVSLNAPLTFADGATDYEFVRWTLNGVDQPDGQTTLTLNISQDTTVIAVYQILKRTLTVQSDPITGVSTTGTPSGTTNYSSEPDDNSEVTLTAPATFTDRATNYEFARWTLNGVDQTADETTLTFNIGEDTTVTAMFEEICTLTINVNPVDAGTTMPAPGTHTYNGGDMVIVAATAYPGYQFDHWSGDISGTTNPTTVIITDCNMSITGHFRRADTISVSPDLLDFGSVKIGVPAVRTISLVNEGEDLDVEISSDNTAFVPCITCAQIPHEENPDDCNWRTVKIILAPVQEGEVNGTLTIKTGSEDIEIPLTGIGVSSPSDLLCIGKVTRLLGSTERIVVGIGLENDIALPELSLKVMYDTLALDVLDFRKAGRTLVNPVGDIDDERGVVEIDVSDPNGNTVIPSGAGTVLEIDFAFTNDAQLGSYPLIVSEVSGNEGTVSIELQPGEINAYKYAILDVDGNGQSDVGTDIVYIYRTLFGLAPVPPAWRVIDPNIPPDEEIAGRVNKLKDWFDVDDSNCGEPDVGTDIVYIYRTLFGLLPVPPDWRVIDPNIPPGELIAANVNALSPNDHNRWSTPEVLGQLASLSSSSAMEGNINVLQQQNDDILSIGIISADPGEEGIVVPISLRVDEDVTLLSLDLIYDTERFDAVELRQTGGTLRSPESDAIDDTNGLIRIRMFDFGNVVIPQGEGLILEAVFNAADDTLNGDYPLAFSNLVAKNGPKTLSFNSYPFTVMRAVLKFGNKRPRRDSFKVVASSHHFRDVFDNMATNEAFTVSIGTYKEQLTFKTPQWKRTPKGWIYKGGKGGIRKFSIDYKKGTIKLMANKISLEGTDSTFTISVGSDDFLATGTVNGVRKKNKISFKR